MSRFNSIVLVTCHLLLVTVCAYGAEQNAANKLERFLEGLDTFQAAFTQTLLDEEGEVIEKSTGEVYIKRPGKFHWQYHEPYSQYLISDGRNLWVYDEDLDQVTIRDIAGSMEDTPAAILGGEVAIDQHYVVVDGQDDGEIDWLELTPRNTDSQYERLRLGFEAEKLKVMVLFDSFGQETRITFLDSQRNSGLDETLFRFEPPEGVDVIDDR